MTQISFRIQTFTQQEIEDAIDRKVDDILLALHNYMFVPCPVVKWMDFRSTDEVADYMIDVHGYPASFRRFAYALLLEANNQKMIGRVGRNWTTWDKSPLVSTAATRILTDQAPSDQAPSDAQAQLPSKTQEKLTQEKLTQEKDLFIPDSFKPSSLGIREELFPASFGRPFFAGTDFPIIDETQAISDAAPYDDLIQRMQRKIKDHSELLSDMIKNRECIYDLMARLAIINEERSVLEAEIVELNNEADALAVDAEEACF